MVPPNSRRQCTRTRHRPGHRHLAVERGPGGPRLWGASSPNGSFVTVQTGEHQHLGYFESQGVGCTASDPAEVSSFGLRYGKLRSQALNVEESARLIERLVGET
ncbi:Scr1 family TA system antitoxin-like transcriptional regulator [Streptomyces sp. NRRL S-15]|uniref:Scr1 family TA system antitoxin-like transcriptional regulator n=1 Tax=Streptomyces sp. NRRL S-15 TaxID=1463886 RepID=UPI003B6369D2